MCAQVRPFWLQSGYNRIRLKTGHAPAISPLRLVHRILPNLRSGHRLLLDLSLLSEGSIRGFIPEGSSSG